MLTQAERDEEAKLTAAEADRPGPNATKWELLAKQYQRQGEMDCCYNCEAGRAYMRAAADFRRAGLPANAADATLAAAYAYLMCGDRCAEAGDFFVRAAAIPRPILFSDDWRKTMRPPAKQPLT
jgi:hypothetical protein